MMKCNTPSDLLQLIIPELVKYSENKNLKSVIEMNELSNIACMWINGISYNKILQYTEEKNVKILRRNKESEIQLSQIIDICDNGFGYSSTLTINAISELLLLNRENSESTCKLLRELNQLMRYGLPTKESIIIYESGFEDRVISLKLADALTKAPILSKRQFVKLVKSNKNYLLDILSPYPRLFTDKVLEMVI